MQRRGYACLWQEFSHEILVTLWPDFLYIFLKHFHTCLTIVSTFWSDIKFPVLICPHPELYNMTSLLTHSTTERSKTTETELRDFWMQLRNFLRLHSSNIRYMLNPQTCCFYHVWRTHMHFCEAYKGNVVFTWLAFYLSEAYIFFLT